MNGKKLVPIICLLVIYLLLASCGPKALNDMEFADAARSTCSTLQAESALLEQLDFSSRATAYRQAAETLNALNITEESAPQGAQLRSGLAGLAISFDQFGTAINNAVIEANLEIPFTVMITEDGSVFAHSGSIFNLTMLNVDPSIITNLKTNQVQVQEAATFLNLEECVIEWLSAE